jgi:hypothetical protein
MSELKRLHSSTSFTNQGASKGLNEYYCQRQSTPFVRAADQRAKKVPKEYEAKAKKADETFGAPGSSAVQEALKAMPQVRGIALGAFGEFSESINLLIEVPPGVTPGVVVTNGRRSSLLEVKKSAFESQNEDIYGNAMSPKGT